MKCAKNEEKNKKSLKKQKRKIFVDKENDLFYSLEVVS